jgi:DNA primase
MALFSQTFLDELRAQADIVQVVQDYVPLKQVGGTYKGLCPFHNEKTPSFHVNRDKGFFHCFGCGTGGDVFKFVELQERLPFPDVGRRLAARFGVALPTPEASADQRADDEARETLLRIHEMAATFFRTQLMEDGGVAAREHLRGRGFTRGTVERLAFGYAPESRDALTRLLLDGGISRELATRSGLVVERENGQLIDRFRHRLMIPICRESGSIVAFGGRALAPQQVPKYLNSPETPIYSKSRVLFGLHLTKQAIRREGAAVLVEGYFDFAQALQAGVGSVVATCGTALTRPQAQLIRRFAARVTLSFDPDSAGQGAVVKSSDLLVQEGFGVSVARLPMGKDPDTFVREAGAEAYRSLVAGARPYLDHLLDLEVARHDLTTNDGRLGFLHAMLAVAARIPDAAGRDQFADRLAHRAEIAEEVVRQEIRRAAAARQTSLPERIFNRQYELKPAERDLLQALLTRPDEAWAAIEWLDEEDLEGLPTQRIFSTARSLRDVATALIPPALFERLTEEEMALVARLAAPGDRALTPLTPVECARTLRRLRYERERALTQHQIKQLQDESAERHADRIVGLLARTNELARRIEELGTGRG